MALKKRMIQTRLKVLLVIVPSLCLAIFTGKLCAWNGTSLLSPNHHDYHLNTAENDSSSSFYYGGDEMPDMWQKPRGGFAGTLGEMLITLPLFNQMDREAAKQRFYIISWPVSGGKSEQEVSGGDKNNEEKPAQTTASFEYSADRKIPIRKSDEEQPPDDDLDHHTHIGEGDHCYASGCNGGRCQCKECSTSLAEQSATKKRKFDRSTDQAKGQPALHQQLRQRENEGTPLSASLLAGLSQGRLSSGIHNSEYRYDIHKYGFNNIGVLSDGRIVSCWDNSGTLTVWSPQTFMPQGHSYAKFYTNPGVNTHNQGSYEVTSVVFYSDIVTAHILFAKSHSLRFVQRFYWAAEELVPILPMDFEQLRDINARKSALSLQASNSHFASLSGHTAKICGVLVKRDGRIVTWSKDQTIRIWTEYNGHWSSVKIELNREVHCSWRLRELGDGRLLFHSPLYPSQITLILFEHEYGWGYETFNGFVGELKDGRLYQWIPDGLRIWRQNSDQDPSYPQLDLSNCANSNTYLQLDDGRIITQTIEDSPNGLGSCIRLWTEQRNRTWTSCLLGRYSPRGIIPVNNRRIVIYGVGYFVVISEVGDQWIASDRISIPVYYALSDIYVLRNGQIVTTGDYSRNRRLGAMIWTEHQNQWHSESLSDESGTPVSIDHVIILRDGRWVSWLDCDSPGTSCEIRIWAHTDNRYSSTVLSNMPDVDQVLELPGGWLVAVSRRHYLSILKVWTLFPAQDKPHN